MWLQLDDPRAPIIKARTLDRELPVAGEAVGLAVSGEVVVFAPAGRETDRLVEPVRLSSAADRT